MVNFMGDRNHNGTKQPYVSSREVRSSIEPNWSVVTAKRLVGMVGGWVSTMTAEPGFVPNNNPLAAVVVIRVEIKCAGIGDCGWDAES
jgi:hypothetical protein